MPGNMGILLMWIVFLILFVIAEAVTAELITIWFAIGSVAAIIAYVCGAPTYVQWIIFTAVSIIALAATRPFVKKITKKKKEATNADRVIGEEAIVTETINNTFEEGAAKVKGVVWTARSQSGEIIEKGSTVKILKIDGVKLIVTKI